MLRTRARVVAGVTGLTLLAGAGLASTASAATTTIAGVPKATALVTVKAHRVADVPVRAKKAVSFAVLGVAGVPRTGVAAVVLKLTASKPGASGYLTAYPTGGKRPAALSVSFTAHHDATSVVVVTPGSKGRVTAANLSGGAVRVVPTVVGYYRKPTSVSAALTYFKAVTPKQVVSAVVKARGSIALTAAGARGVPAVGVSGVTGVVLEVSALAPAKAGALTLTPSGATRSKVTALSFAAHRSATNLVTVAPGAKGRVVVASTAKAAVRVRVDVVGYLVALSPVGGRPGSLAVTPHAGGAQLTWTAAKTDPGAPVLRYGVTIVPLAPAGASRTVYTVGHVTSFDVTGLAVGGRYAFQVFAVTREGHSAPSPLSAPVTLAAPAAPTSVVATSTAPGSVTVTWAAAADTGPALTGYTVSGAHSGPVTVPPTATSHTFTGLTVGQTFVATVTATNAVGTSVASSPSTAVLVAGPAGSNVTSPVSVDTAGAFHGPVVTGPSAVSADGRLVAFSASSALVGGDSNGVSDVFLRDRQAGTTIRLSSNGPAAGNAASTDVAITPDGRYVAFDSLASDLVAGDTNARQDVFVYDTTTSTLARVSLTDTGAEGDKAALAPAISADGRYVAFLSNSTNLIGSETNLHFGVYVRDLTAGTTKRVSQAVGGGLLGVDISHGPSISADGRWVGYSSEAPDVVAGDSNGAADAFVYDQTAGTTARVSVGAAGVQANGGSGTPLFTADAHAVVLTSDASNLVAGDTNAASDVFVRDLTAGTTTRVSLANDGGQANGASTAASLSSDGTRILFTSTASNLVVGDTNGQPDAFLRYVTSGETVRVSVGSGQLASGGAAGAISGNGLVTTFTSADALQPGDTNGVPDLFARTLG